MSLDRLVNFNGGTTSSGEVIMTQVSAGNPLPVTGAGAGGATPVEGVTSTGLTTSQASVGVTSAPLLAANPARTGASFVNVGPNYLFIGKTAGVTATTGFPIPPNTAFNIDIPLYTGAIFGICASGSSALVGIEEMSP